MKTTSMFVVLVMAAFFGGWISNVVLDEKGLSDEEIETVKAYVEIARRNGRVNELDRPGGVVNLYGPDGKPRLEIGSYSGSVSASERGQPLIAFHDNRQRLRLLFRLAGSNDAPVLVFKDTDGRDRMVIGLALTDGGEEPFIVSFDEDGKKTLVTGSY